MIYFWFIPLLILLIVLLWILYGAATRRRAGRTEGKTLVDKPSQGSRGAS